MNILDKIVINKRREVGLRKSLIPSMALERYPLFARQTISLKQSITNSTNGIIAEHKRRSPSKSIINQSLNICDVALGYKTANVAGMSVLTDTMFFGGSLDDLVLARASCNLPILRKDFIIDEYQIIEAKAYGADVILLIASILGRDSILKFSKLAKKLGLEILLEVHNLEELQKSAIPSVDLVGVNNRNLKTFEVNLETSKKLSKQIPEEFIKVSESGISTTAAVKELKKYGYKGFLIGEKFMKTTNPGACAKQFIDALQVNGAPKNKSMPVQK